MFFDVFSKNSNNLWLTLCPRGSIIPQKRVVSCLVPFLLSPSPLPPLHSLNTHISRFFFPYFIPNQDTDICATAVTHNYENESHNNENEPHNDENEPHNDETWRSDEFTTSEYTNDDDDGSVYGPNQRLASSTMP